MLDWLRSIENDPLARFAVFRSSETVQKWGTRLGWPLLPAHLHEILLFAGIYLLVYLTPDLLLRNKKWYGQLSADQKGGIANHACSEANALIALTLSFPLFFSNKLTSLVSYTPYAGLVAAACSGYFLFDVYICVRWFKGSGWGFLLHAFAALFVFMQGNRPFMHNYSAPFVWFEASTTFVNIHWLASNIPGLVPKQLELVNGGLLIAVFALCRVIPGPINGYKLFKVALTTDLPGVPMWLVTVILICYTVLTALNIFWFGMMISVAYSVLGPKKSKTPKAPDTKAPDTKAPDTKAPAIKAQDKKGESITGATSSRVRRRA